MQPQKLTRNSIEPLFESFFDGYAKALEALDLKNLLEYYHGPLMVYYADEIQVFLQASEFQVAVEELFKIYRVQKFASAKYQILDIQHVDKTWGVVSLHWQHLNHKGQPIADFVCHYHMVTFRDQPKILVIYQPNTILAGISSLKTQ